MRPSAKDPRVEMRAFVRSSDAVYVWAPADAREHVASLVMALLRRIKRAVHRRESGWPPVLWALDEAANIASLPSLPSVVSEGGGQGPVSHRGVRPERMPLVGGASRRGDLCGCLGR
jgi:type IV secretion system protein VirD4